jgi:REP element-mobilizing transposase RayT
MQKISSGDLVRYVRLKSPDRLLLLYATRLVDDFSLALVMDAKTNFRDVREVTKRFSSGLLQPPGKGTEHAQEKDASGEPIKPDKEMIVESVDEEEVPVPKLSLGDVPVPTPETMRHAVPRNSQLNKFRLSRDSSSIHAETDLQNDWPAVEVGSEMRMGEISYTISGEESGSTVPDPGRNIQIAQTPGLPEAYEVIRTQAGPEQKFVMRVLSPAIYTLQYACLLLPRLPDHLLTGDLSVRLTYWLPRLMMAFGWRLERLAMQADYLHWIVSVPPEASAEYVLERTRIHTSEQIFQEFPRLKLENPSGDFWAPGYLVMTGTIALPENVVRQYIAHTRYRQGFSGDWQ